MRILIFFTLGITSCSLDNIVKNRDLIENSPVMQPESNPSETVSYSLNLDIPSLANTKTVELSTVNYIDLLPNLIRMNISGDTHFSFECFAENTGPAMVDPATCSLSGTYHVFIKVGTKEKEIYSLNFDNYVLSTKPLSGADGLIDFSGPSGDLVNIFDETSVNINFDEKLNHEIFEAIKGSETISLEVRSNLNTTNTLNGGNGVIGSRNSSLSHELILSFEYMSIY